MPLSPGDLREVKTIAHGGMALLTLARTPDGKEVVKRELHRKYMLRPRTHMRFLRGLRIREMLSPHDHIVRPLTRGYHGLLPYEILEYVPGHNLHEWILRRREKIESCALTILKDVAEAVAFMHEKHILHLDVKAENVLIDTGGDSGQLNAKLTDFDLSRNVRGEHNHLHAGTESHMAPEQLAGGDVSYSNDIFAFGVMAYYLVTGRMPFAAYSLKDVRRRQMSKSYKVTEPTKINPDLAPKLNWIIMRCLEKDRSQRFPHTAYLVQELSRV